MASLVLVAGSGRSGTSLLAGMLQRSGYAVPQPEVPADETNPRGFAEALWVVRFHHRMLADARVQGADGRPGAWERMRGYCERPEVREELRAWLAGELERTPRVVIKDPRLSFFLPLWRDVGAQLGAQPRFVMMLRHPAAVVDSKLRSYPGTGSATGRAAGWVNQTLFTELATRSDRRDFVAFDDLLTYASGTLRGLGIEPPPDLDTIVDPRLTRSSSDWDRHPVPERLRELADRVWELIGALDLAGLDAAREAYVRLYAESEAIVESTIATAA